MRVFCFHGRFLQRSFVDIIVGVQVGAVDKHGRPIDYMYVLYGI